MKNEGAFHKPLHVKDTEAQTYGCRYSNPDICKRNRIPKVCAFARDDNMCLSPSSSWKKQFRKLLNEKGKSG